MTYAADPRVDAYIDALPDWQQAICRQVRDLVHAADPEVTETSMTPRRSSTTRSPQVPPPPPPANEHGWRLARITDPFGHQWEIGRPLGTWPPPPP
jgi:hypothetical protein